MPFVEALRALAVAGPLASRAFLPLLVLAGVARWPGLVTWIPGCPDPPVLLPPAFEWLGTGWALGVLAALAALELLADKDPDAREALELVAPFLRTAAAVVAALAVTDAASAEALRSVAGLAPLDPGASPTPLDAARPLALAAGAGVATWTLSRWRRSLLEPVREAGDDIGASRVASWAEDAWAAGGLLLLIAAPLLAILAALALGGALALAQRAAERRAESQRVPCPSCGHRVRPEAQACPACSARFEARASASSPLWPDRWPDALAGERAGAHELDLLARGRCPRCAEARPAADLLAGVPHACGWQPAPGLDWRDPLRGHVRRRALRLVIPALVVGLVPIVGPAVALVLGRLRVAAPLRRFLPATARVRARWTSRLVALVLLLGAGLPIASAVVSALLVASQEWAWGRAFDRARRDQASG